MVWGTGGFKSCESLLDRIESNDEQLVDLTILPMKSFTENDVKRLCKILESGKNTTLKSISASGHFISIDGYTMLGSAIASQKNKPGITSIAIGDEKMGDEGIIALCGSSLKEVHGGLLESVDFAFKSISHVGAKSIGQVFGCSQHLKKLILYRNHTIGDDGLVALCSAAVVSASSSPLSSSSSSSKPFPALQYLDLSECNIGPKGIEALVVCLTGDNDNMKKRSIQHSSQQAQHAPKLINLNLNSNTIGPLSCNHLQRLISSAPYGHSLLRSISLKKCSICNDGIELLANTMLNQSCAYLESLDLCNNNITSRGAVVLAKALKDGKHNIQDLKQISFADNSIGEEGVCALANAMDQGTNSGGNSTLCELDLTNTECGISGATTLMKCTSLSSLRLFNNKLGSNGIEELSLHLVGGHPCIEHLDLGGNRGNGESVGKLLKAIMQDQSDFLNVLRTLELGGNENNDESLFEAARKKRPDMDIAPVKETPKDLPSDE